jgi:hypothetical protein
LNNEYVATKHKFKNEQGNGQHVTLSFQLSRRPLQAENTDNAAHKQQVTSLETVQTTGGFSSFK